MTVSYDRVVMQAIAVPQIGARPSLANHSVDPHAPLPQDSRLHTIYTDPRLHVDFTVPARMRNWGPVASNDDAAVLQTLDLMERIVRRAACHPIVQAAALEATQGLGTARDKAEAIWAYVRTRVRFVPDDAMYTDAREVLIEPPLLLSMADPQGDCDDFTMAVAALCLASGIPARVDTVGADPGQPGRFSHVFAEAQLEDGTFITIDASHGQYAGWSVPNPFRRVPWALMKPTSTACSSPGEPGQLPLWIALVASGAAIAAAIALIAVLRKLQ